MQDTFTLHCVGWKAAAEKMREAFSGVHKSGHFSIQTEDMDRSSSYALVLATDGNAIGCARITASGTTERVIVMTNENREQIESALNLAAMLHVSHSAH